MSQGLGLLVLLVDLFALWHNKNSLSKREFGNYLGFIVIPVLSLLGNIFLKGITYSYIGSSFGILLLGINIQSRRSQIEQEKLTNEKVLAMVSQIQPHFIYNALSTIKALYKIDTVRGEKMLDDFSEYLRGNIDALTDDKPIPFTKELKHVKKYLNLEKELSVFFVTISYMMRKNFIKRIIRKII